MLTTFVFLAILSEKGVWSETHHALAPATFRDESQIEVEWRYYVSAILFTRPVEIGTLCFRDSDSAENDATLNNLLNPPKKMTSNVGQDFRTSLEQLASLESGSIVSPEPSRLGAAIRCVHEVGSGLIADVRGRLLCREVALLLTGFAKPSEAASELEILSRQARSVSPSIGQAALVHAIDLYRAIGMKKAANHLFLLGKQDFLPNNPTEYRYRFWKSAKEAVSIATPSLTLGHPTIRRVMQFVEPHPRWRF